MSDQFILAEIQPHGTLFAFILITGRPNLNLHLVWLSTIRIPSRSVYSLRTAKSLDLLELFNPLTMIIRRHVYPQSVATVIFQPAQSLRERETRTWASVHSLQVH